MRDLERISRILKKLYIIWQTEPDLRLGQILENIAESRGIDLFYLEDEELERLFDIIQEEIDKPYYGN